MTRTHTGAAPGWVNPRARQAGVLAAVLLAWAVAAWAIAVRAEAARGGDGDRGEGRDEDGSLDAGPAGSPVPASRRTVVTVSPEAGAAVDGYAERLALVLIGGQATPAPLAKDDR